MAVDAWFFFELWMDFAWVFWGVFEERGGEELDQGSLIDIDR